eukprot:7731002-Alexandrium_andersonii.AAC.1
MPLSDIVGCETSEHLRRPQGPDGWHGPLGLRTLDTWKLIPLRSMPNAPANAAMPHGPMRSRCSAAAWLASRH